MSLSVTFCHQQGNGGVGEWGRWGVEEWGACARPRKPAGGGSPCGDRKEGASPHGLRLRLAVCAAPSLALSGLAAPPDTKSPFGPREIARHAGEVKKGVGESGGVGDHPFRAACETGVFVFRFRRFSCPPSGRTRRVADKARAANGLPFTPMRTDVRQSPQGDRPRRRLSRSRASALDLVSFMPKEKPGPVPGFLRGAKVVNHLRPFDL